MNKVLLFIKWGILMVLLFMAQNSSAQWVLIDDTSGTPDASAGLEIRSTDRGVLIPRLTTTQMTSIPSPATGLMIFNADSGAFYFYSGSGWVGIRNGSDTLSVIQNTSGTNKVEIDNSTIRFEQGGSEKMRVHSDGNVGIGTTTPGSPIHVEGTAPANANSGQIQISETGSDNMTLGRTTTYGFVQAHNSEPLSLNPLGNNVGVGTTAPDSALTVQGGIQASYIRLTEGAASGEVLTSDGQGNATWTSPVVGSLGDTTQLADLDNDTRVVTDLSGADDDQVRIYNAGTQYVNFKAGGRIEPVNNGQSVFLGEGAGASDDLSANGNVFMGYKAGTSNSTGAQNVAIGYNSYSTGTASSNVAVGYSSLSSATSSNNVALGTQAMNATTSGEQNTAVGSSALQTATTASRNTLIGYQAGSGSFTGNNNVGIGAEALESGTGSNNVAIGRRALQTFGAGANNVVIGVNAMRTNASSNNVAIGDDAGQNNTTGSGNVFLGYQAGQNETGNNKLYIDNSNTTSPLILGDFSTNAITLNGSLSIGSAFTFPTADGSANQVLTTDGSSSVSWASLPWTVSGSNIYYNTGNVGIGESSPTSALHIAKNGAPQLLVSPSSTTGEDAGLTIRGSRNGATSALQAQLNFENYDNDLGASNKLGLITGVVTNAVTNIGDLVFYSYADGSTANEAMRIEHDGQVGINTSNPATDLDVNGDIEADNIKLTSGSSNNRILVSDSDGDASWSDNISVNGNATVGGTTTLGGNTSVTGNVTASGKMQSSTIKVTSGAGNNKVLVSDADGDGTWTDINSVSGQARSIVIPIHSLSDDQLSSGSTYGTTTWDYRYVNFPDANTTNLAFSIPIPSDHNGSNIDVKLTYTSTTNTGNFYVFISWKGLTSGGTFGGSPGGNWWSIPAPATANTLTTYTRSNIGVSSTTEFIHIYIRRNGSNAIDTSTGDFRIFGITIDYTN